MTAGRWISLLGAPTVGEIRPGAAGADSGKGNILRQDSGTGQLRPAYFPEIEVIAFHLEDMQFPRQFPVIMHKLSTAGTK